MDKRILKKVAKEWAKGILLATDLQSFDGDLTPDEEQFIVDEVRLIAERLTKEPPLGSLPEILKKYYVFE